MFKKCAGIALSMVLAVSLTPLPATAATTGSAASAAASAETGAAASSTGTVAFNGQYDDNLYQPDTAAVDAPLAIWQVGADQAQDVAATLGGNARPQVVEVAVDRNLDTYSSDGTAATGLSVNEVLTLCGTAGKHVIPMFRVKAGDTTAAKALAVQLKADNACDVYVISDDADTVQVVTSKTSGPRGVVDYSALTSLPDAGADLAEYEYAATQAGCNTVLFDAAALDKDRVDYLRDRFMTVWSTVDAQDYTVDGAEDASVRTAAFQTAVLEGVQGVAAADYKQTYTALERYQQANTLLRPPSVVGHRGSKADSGYAENSLGAFRWAVQQGDRVLETDIWDTDLGNASDTDALVISHNNPGTGKGALKLAKVLEAYQDTDELIFVEIKLNRKTTGADGKTSTYRSAYGASIAAKLKNLIEVKYPKAKDNVVFISFYSPVLKQVRKALPWAPRADLTLNRSSSFTTGTASSSSRCVQLESLGASLNSSYAAFASGSMAVYGEVLRQRGLRGSCHTADNEWLDALMLAGTSMITSNTSERAKDYVTKIRAKAKLKQSAYTIIGNVAENSITLKGFTPSSYVNLYTQYGSRFKVSSTSAAVGVTSLDGNLVKSDSTWKFRDDDNMQSLVTISYTQTMGNGKKYTVYSDPILLVGVGVDETVDRVKVNWVGATGKVLSSESYYVKKSADGEELLSPNPIYKYANPSKSPSKTKHYTFKGWKSSVDGKTYTGEIAALTSAQAQTTVTYTAQFTGHKHGGSKATCTKAQVCPVCGYRVHTKLGHSYKAGICTRCGKVTKKSKVSIKSPVAKKKAVTIRWKKKSGAGGYRVKVSLKRKDGTWGAWKYVYVSKKKAAYTWKKLKSKRTYRVRVRVYVKVNGKKVGGTWSAVKTVKTK